MSLDVRDEFVKAQFWGRMLASAVCGPGKISNWDRGPMLNPVVTVDEIQEEERETSKRQVCRSMMDTTRC